MDDTKRALLGGYGLIVLAALAWGTLGPLSRVVLAEGIHPLEVSFWRAALAWPCVLVHCLATGRARLDRPDAGRAVIFGLVCVAAFYASYQFALREVGAALASVLLYTAPAWVALLAWLFLGERMGARKLLVVAMACAGVMAICLGPVLGPDAPRLRPRLLGVLTGLGAGITYALYYVLGRSVIKRRGFAPLLLVALPVGGLVLLVAVLLETSFGPKSATAWLCLGLLGVGCTYLPLWAFYAGLRRVAPTRAAVVATFEPVVATGLAVGLWAEPAPWSLFAGLALVLAGCLLSVLDDLRTRAP